MKFTNYIKNILTLRYDPNKKPGRKPLTPKDFKPIDYKNHDYNVESKIINLIKDDLLKKQNQFRFKNVSLPLSSGIDSGITLAMIKKKLPETKIHCISVGFGNKEDETKRAQELARIYDCDFHQIILDSVLKDLPKLIKIVKEPRWNLYPFYALKEGKKKSKVFFTGDGGDEIFGGYTFRYQKFFSRFSKKTNWQKRIQLYLSCHERDWVPDQERIFGNKMKFSWKEIYKIFVPYFRNYLSPIDQIFLADFNGKLLYDWIPTNNSFAKYLKLNVESIFLSNKMIKFATHLPWTEKYNIQSNIGKIPLQNILKTQKGFTRKKIMKKGFGTNLSYLWKKDGNEIVSKFVNKDSEIIKNGIIDLSWVNKTNRIINGRDKNLSFRYINKMFLLLALEIWFRLFITKKHERE